MHNTGYRTISRIVRRAVTFTDTIKNGGAIADVKVAASACARPQDHVG